MTDELILHDFWRSSASYRVRIALSIKGLAWRTVPHSLTNNAHLAESYVALNPQAFVPALQIGDMVLTQSLAILDYLDTLAPDPRLFPADPLARAQAMARALVIVADIHPLNNLRVMRYLKGPLGQTQDAADDWYRHWIAQGFAALEAQAPEVGLFGGTSPDVVDVCLVPQMYNARRLECDLTDYPKLNRIDAALQSIETVAAAHPDRTQQA